MQGQRTRDGGRGRGDSEHRLGGGGQGGHPAHVGKDVGLPGEIEVKNISKLKVDIMNPFIHSDVRCQ